MKLHVIEFAFANYSCQQIFPSPKEANDQRPLTRLQERLIKKLGPNAYPFFFEVPPHCPASVSLQPAPGDTGKPCGVDYELKAFVGECSEDKPHKRNSVRLAIRKIMYAPSKLGEQPSIEVSKEFMLKPNKIHLEASLDKEVKSLISLLGLTKFSTISSLCSSITTARAYQSMYILQITRVKLLRKLKYQCDSLPTFVSSRRRSINAQSPKRSQSE